MSEAQRLKMTGGHFIWIWADTSSTAEFFEPNNVPDDKDQLMKSNYHSQGYNERKTKYDKLSSSPGDRQYHQQNSNKRPQQNSTRHKSPNTNSNRFHHIIGLRKPGDENGGGLPAVLPDRSFLSADKIPGKEKRDVKDSDFDGSAEKVNKLNIKNINSHEFNANYYDPYTPRGHENVENIFGGDDEEESHEENEYWDYDKVNPFQSTTATFTTTRRTASDTGASQANNRKNANNSNRNSRNNGNNHKPPTPSDQITTVPYSKIFDDKDDLDLDEYSEASESDPKAKRADNFPSAFNISSHVFFHHFKDFPVGLLALRHIKMNVDRVFVRSAVRLFATTWSRVERDEELRVASGGKVGYRPKSNWEDSWSDYDEDEAITTPRANNRKQKNKNNFSVSNRQNNARGSRKYKRDTQGERAADDNPTISHLVNSSNKTTINSNSKLIANKTYSQHVSGLNSHASDVENKSNNDNIKNNSNKTEAAVNGDQETVHELNLKGKIEVVKRQGSWWSNLFRGNQEKPKVVTRGTPQYKGGCFGVPTRSDAKRSELFARWDENLNRETFEK